MRSIERLLTLRRRMRWALELARPLRVPGLPAAPRFLALVVLRFPALMPVRLRWRATADGLGLVVSRLTSADQDAVVGEVLEDVGREQGRALSEQLRYGATPLECARAVALANRLVRIKASAGEASSGDGSAYVVTPGCPWSHNEWWSAVPCGAFSRYERGLARGLNPAVGIRYASKKTRGDDVCVGVYSIGAGTSDDGEGRSAQW